MLRSARRKSIATGTALWVLALITVTALDADTTPAPGGTASNTPSPRGASDVVATDSSTHAVYLPYAATDTSMTAKLDVLDQVGGEVLAIAPSDRWLFVVRGSRFLVMDVHDAANLALVGRTPDLGCTTTDMDAHGSVAYLACGNALVVVDAAEPWAPRRIGSVILPGAAFGLRASGDLVAVAVGAEGVVIVDVGDPAQPRILGRTTDLPFGGDVVLFGHHVLVAGGVGGLVVLDIADPAIPRVVFVERGPGNQASGSPALGIDLTGTLAVVSFRASTRYLGIGGVGVYDVSDPATPRVISAIDVPASPFDVRACGDKVFVTHEDEGMSIFDLSSPNSPRQVARHTTTPAYDVRIDGMRAYVMAQGTVEILDLSQIAYPVLLGHEHLADNWAQRANAVAVHGGYAFAVTCRAGLQVYAVGDPATPWLAASVPTEGCPTDVAWMSGSVFIADGAGGIVEVDVAHPSAPRLAAVVHTTDPVGELAADAGFVYAGGSRGSLLVLDARIPGSPRGIAQLALPGGVGEITVAGTHLVEVNGTNGLRVIDVRDPARPRLVGQLDVPSEWYGLDSVAVIGDVAFVTMSFQYRSGSRDWLGVVDVGDPSSPRWIGGIYADGTAVVAIDAQRVALFSPTRRDAINLVDVRSPRSPTGAGAYALALGIGYWGDFLTAVGSDAGVLYAFTYTGLAILDVRGASGPKTIGTLPREVPVDAVGAAGAGGTIVVVDAEASDERLPWEPPGHLLVIDPKDGPASRLPLLSGADCLSSWWDQLPDPGPPQIDGDRGYVAVGCALGVYDLGDRREPLYVGRCLASDGQPIRDFVVAGALAILLLDRSLSLLDVSDPRSMTEVATWSPGNIDRFVGLATTDGVAYVIGRSMLDDWSASRMWVVDLTAAAAPRLVAEVAVSDGAADIAAARGLVVIGGNRGIDILDVTDPNRPSVVGWYAAIGDVRHVFVHDAMVYAASPYVLTVLDITSRSNPRPVGALAVGSTGVVPGSDGVYVAAGERGMLRVRVPAHSR
jgi:hypothetical protein